MSETVHYLSFPLPMNLRWAEVSTQSEKWLPGGEVDWPDHKGPWRWALPIPGIFCLDGAAQIHGLSGGGPADGLAA